MMVPFFTSLLDTPHDICLIACLLPGYHPCILAGIKSFVLEAKDNLVPNSLYQTYLAPLSQGETHYLEKKADRN